jgi:ABC-2 type transport system permease protein
MRKAWVIAWREYLALVTTKSFIFTMLFSPLLWVLVAVFVGSESEPSTEGPRSVVLVDASRIVEDRLARALREEGLEVKRRRHDANPEHRRRDLQSGLGRGEFLAWIEVDSKGPEQASVRVYVDNVASAWGRRIRQIVVETVRFERLRRAGVDEADLREVMRPVAVSLNPPPVDGVDVAPEAAVASLLVPLAIFMLTLMGVMSGSVPLLQAVVEEKQQRISEVLLGAVSPTELMLGKLFGATGVGVTVLGTYLVGGFVAAVSLDYARYVPFSALLLSFGIAVLAMVMYGSIFLSLGAASTDLKDAQGLLTPVMMLLVGPMLVIPRIAEAPNGELATALSLFPLTAPVTMPLRLGLSQTVPAWQIPLAFALAMATTCAIVWASGRIFRIGILSQGKVPSIRQLIRWVLSG